MAKARLRRGIEIIKLANRIESLKMQEDESSEAPGDADVPADAKNAAGEALTHDAGDFDNGLGAVEKTNAPAVPKKSLSDFGKGAIFREVVLAKVREEKEKETALKVEKEAHEKEARRRSFQS
jgi:calcium/calmodulin-dependent protein kinase I